MVLAVPVLPTRGAGTKVNAAVWANDVTAAINWLLAPPEFVGSSSVSQSIATGSWTSLNLPTEIFDNAGGHSTVSNTSRYVAQAPGLYTVCGVYAPAPNATGFRASRIAVNGSPILGTASYLPANGTAEVGVVTPTRSVRLVAGDYVEVQGWQSSGGALGTAPGGTDIGVGLWVRWSNV